VEVNSDTYDYRGDVLTFHDHVNGKLLDGDTTRGTLESGILTAASKNVVLKDGRRTNELESIVAERDVHLRQLPTLDVHGKLVESDFQSGRLDIEMRTNDLIKTVVATGGVRATRDETSANGAKPVHLTLATEEMTATFMPDTNMVRIVVADGGVLLTRNEENASGAHVVYTATNDTVVLTGNPQLEQSLPFKARMTAEDAIIYDRARGVVRGTGNPRTLIDIPSGNLSQSNLPMMPEKKAP
jgi:lipopolysaccharide export system protein LptA